jgi:hypothetical protein
MIKALHLLRPLFLVVCLIEGTASAQTLWSQSDPAGLPDLERPILAPYTSIQGMRESLRQPTANTFLLNLGPKIIELKTAYLEKTEENRVLANASIGSQPGRYFDALATSSVWNGKLIGEGELAYSTLGLTPASEETPKLLRMALKGQWAGMKYGADYRSVAHGFLFLTGAIMDQARDESQLWGEYNLGPFRIRGTLGELREKIPDANQLILTRTAGTSFIFNRSDWSGTLYSNYSVIEQETTVSQKTLAFTNGISASYRPLKILTLEPNLSLKEEWDPKTGARTGTPSAGLLLSSTPFQGAQLIGRTSYARGRSEGGLKDIATVSTAAVLNWQLEKSLRTERLLSFQIEYNSQLDFRYRPLSQEALTGKLQLKIVGF